MAQTAREEGYPQAGDEEARRRVPPMWLAEDERVLTTRQDHINQSYHKPIVVPRPKTREKRKKRQETHSRQVVFRVEKKMQFTALSLLSGLNFTISSGNQRLRRLIPQRPPPQAVDTIHTEEINSEQTPGSTLVIKQHKGTPNWANCSDQIPTSAKFPE